MDSWEDEEVEAVGLKANWDDSDEEEDIPIKEPVSQPTKPTPTSLPPKKKSLSQKIAEREAEEQKRKQQADSPKETEAQRKEREQQLIIESDLENAKELFAATSIKNCNLIIVLIN